MHYRNCSNPSFYRTKIKGTDHCHFLILIILEPDKVYLRCFTLRPFDISNFIVWHIKGTEKMIRVYEK